MHNPLITVYIVSHNYGRYLGDAIESVLRQSVDSWELLVIDNGSTDNTPEVMNLYKGDERLRLFMIERVGLPTACNLARKEAKGKYIIRLDGDDIFDENILLVLSNYLERHPEVAIAFPDYYLIDEFGEIYGEERRQKIAHRNHVLDIPANGACTMIRTEILDDVGGYREDLSAQDGFDLWSKIIRGHKCTNINLPLFYYRRHEDNLTNKFHHILAARRVIKMDTITRQLDAYRPIIATISCRRNFDFCLDLWKQDFEGKTLLQRKIEICLASKIFDHVVVTSDNPEVNETIAHYKDKRLVFVERRKEDTIRSKKLVFTLEKVALKLDPQLKGITAVVYIPTPFMNTGTLEEAVSTLVINTADCSLGVVEVNDPLYKRSSHGLEAINPPRELSSDFDIVYRESNVALATRNANFKTGSLTGSKIINFIVASEECLFIDSQMSLEIARKIYRYKSSKV